MPDREAYWEQRALAAEELLKELYEIVVKEISSGDALDEFCELAFKAGKALGLDK